MSRARILRQMVPHLNESAHRIHSGEYVVPERGTHDNPMCINCFCPSAHECSRFICEPVSDAVRGATVFIDPRPGADGKCADFVALEARS